MLHFDEMTCLLYLDGQLDRERAAQLSAHIESCADCRTLLYALEHESRLLRNALAEEDEPVPARLLEYAPEGERREAIPMAWLAALGLAGAGAYTLWTGIVVPWQQQLNQAGFGGDSLLAMLFFGGVFWKGWETMLNLTELLAAATLVLLAIAFFRRHARRTTTMAVVLAAMACLLALPPAASAAEIRHVAAGVTVAADEVIKNDLIAASNTVKIEGTVEGDLIAFCRNLTVNGRVKGDVIAFAQIVRINGAVDGNVRSFSNYVSYAGTVGKNVTAFTETFELASKSTLGGSLTMFAAMASQDGRVGRDLLSFVADHQLDGSVGGAALMKCDKLTIGPSADILGKVSITSQHEPSISDKAKFSAGKPEIKIEKRGPDYASPKYYWHQTLKWGAAFVLALLVALLMPAFLRESIQQGERYVLSLGAGVLALVVTPVVAIIACITIVGLAVAISLALFYVVAIYSSQIFASAFLGEKLLGRSEGMGALIGRLAIGLLIIRVLSMIPYVGGFVWLVVILFGMGVMALAITRRVRPAEAAA
jgi:anti-sigma factor RsiW